MEIALKVSERSNCLNKRFGAVIVQHDEIIATGYNGSPRGFYNCCDLGFCTRIKVNAREGERYDLCPAVHAEQNAIISASRRDMYGGTLYMAGYDLIKQEEVVGRPPCETCMRHIVNAGLSWVIIKVAQPDVFRELPVNHYIAGKYLEMRKLKERMSNC